MVEVQCWRFDTMVQTVMRYLMFGKGELRNFRYFAMSTTCSEGFSRTITTTELGYSDRDWLYIHWMLGRYECCCLKTLELYQLDGCLGCLMFCACIVVLNVLQYILDLFWMLINLVILIIIPLGAFFNWICFNLTFLCTYLLVFNCMYELMITMSIY